MAAQIEVGDDLDVMQLHDDPVFYCRVAFGFEPTEQQRGFLHELAKPGAKVAVRSGHGTGKSTALAIAAIWFLDTHIDALVPCTAPTAHQLQDVLWREMYRLYNLMPGEMRKEIRFTSDNVKRKGSSGMIVPRTARPENPDALQGFHADEILFIIDEASGVADPIFEVARGALSTSNARVALTGNPTRLTGYYFNAFNSQRDNWTRLQFSCLDSPLVDPKYPTEIAAEYGEDSDMYRVRVLGEFPRESVTSMIPADRVDAAFAKTLPLHAVDYAPVILGVDPAWEGTDRSTIVKRQGIFANVLFVGRGLDGAQLAAKVMHHRDSEHADHIFVDKGGVGASCYDFLKTNGCQTTGISFAQSPTTDGFLNRRAEMWWRMREWFQEEVALTFHADIKQDLIGPEYGRKDNGKIYLESKDSMRKRGLASPDLGDALALTFALPVHGKGHRSSVQNTFSKKFNPYAALERR